MKCRKWLCGIAVLLALSIFTLFVMAQETQTVTGTVTDDYLLVDDSGAIYVISDLEKGEDLFGHVGSRVRVTGIIQEHVDGPMIEVSGFEVLSD